MEIQKFGVLGLALLAFALIAPDAHANSSGRNPSLLNPNQGCGECHSNGSGTTTVDIEFDEPLYVGFPTQVRITVENDEQSAGGFGLAFDGGGVSSDQPSGVRRWNATSASHLGSNSDSYPFEWVVNWTPERAGTNSYTLFANAVDLSGTTRGDSPTVVFGSVDVEEPAPDMGLPDMGMEPDMSNNDMGQVEPDMGTEVDLGDGMDLGTGPEFDMDTMNPTEPASDETCSSIGVTQNTPAPLALLGMLLGFVWLRRRGKPHGR